MTMTLDDWFKDVQGRFIDADRANGGQCWDLVQDYLTRVLDGGSLQTSPSPHAGYAIGCWDGFSSNGLTAWFSQAPATATPLPGWVPVWKWGQVFYPTSHIAVVIKDMPGGMVSCMTQNPGPAHSQPLPKLGLAGYLVPKFTAASGVQVHPAAVTTGTGNPAIDAVASAAGTIADFQRVLSWFGNSENWKRIGLFLIGAIILYMAILVLVSNSGAAKSIINTAKEI